MPKHVQTFIFTYFLFYILILLPYFQCKNEKIKSVYEEEEEHLDFESMKQNPKTTPKPTPKVEVIKYYRLPLTEYKIEFTIIFLIILYLINFYVSLRSTRSLLVNWLKSNFDLLSKHYTHVGNTKSNDKLELNRFSSVAPDRYILWCTGDENSRGLLFYFSLLPRSDLAFGVWSRIHAEPDLLEITLVLNPHVYERFVFFAGRKTFWQKPSNSLQSAKSFCRDYSELKSHDYPESIVVMSESQEIVKYFFNSDLSQEILKLYKYFNYILITDLSENITVIDTSLEKEEMIKSNIIITLSIELTESAGIWIINPLDLTALITSFVETMKKLSSIRLSKETKQNIEKSRFKFNEEKFKADHLQRQETAMQKKDEKLKMLKKKLVEETDVEKQIKLKEHLEKIENKQKLKKMSKGKSVRVIM